MTMQAVSYENEISKEAYGWLGGCLNSSLVKWETHNGNHTYTTYHHIGYGQAYWNSSIRTQ